MNKQTLYFAIYVDVQGMSSQKAKETLQNFILSYAKDKAQNYMNQYDERIFFLPTKEGGTRIELLFPSPLISEEQADKLYEKYFEKFKKITENIEKL